MNSKSVLIIIGIWFLFMVLAIINAGLRENIYKPAVGDLAAHQISSIVFIGLILLTTYLALGFANIELNDYQALLVGTVWLAFTIIFEFIAGYYVFGNSWEKLLDDYNLLEGRIWSLVLLTIFLAPYITSRIR